METADLVIEVKASSKEVAAMEETQVAMVEMLAAMEAAPVAMAAETMLEEVAEAA